MLKWMQRLTGRVENNTITTSRDLAEVLLGDLGSLSGVTVSPRTAMGVSVIQSAVRAISETIGMLPFVLFERGYSNGRETKTPAIDHDLWPLINRKPNNFMTTQEFRETLTMHLCLYGNGYAYINRVRGHIVELLPLQPDRVEVEQKKDWSIVYRVYLSDGKARTMQADEVFHLRDMSDNGYSGISRVKQCAESLGLTKAAENYASTFFGNDATPSGILRTDKPLNKDDIEKIRDSWIEVHKNKRHGTAVLDNGFEWKSVASTAENAQLLETRKFQIAETARIFRTPPHIIGDLERATFSNIENQDLAFSKYTMMPWEKRWELGVDTQLLSEADQKKYYSKIRDQALLRGDSKSRGQYYQIMRQNKIMNANEIRELEDMNPYEGGDIYDNPNITPGDNQGNDDEEQLENPKQD